MTFEDMKQASKDIDEFGSTLAEYSTGFIGSINYKLHKVEKPGDPVVLYTYKIDWGLGEFTYSEGVGEFIKHLPEEDDITLRNLVRDHPWVKQEISAWLL